MVLGLTVLGAVTFCFGAVTLWANGLLANVQSLLL